MSNYLMTDSDADVEMVCEVATGYRIIDRIKEGLPFAELEKLQEYLAIPMEQLAEKLSISKATLQRRKQSGKLDTNQSDRLVRYQRLIQQAKEALEGAENARIWLKSPQVGLGGATPLDFADTEYGAREVENLLGRIAYGVYS